MSKINKANITREYKGYTNRLEITNTPDPSYMVEGSLNCVVDWMNTVGQRNGYTAYGEKVTGAGITGQANWRTNRGQFYIVRKVGTALQVRLKDADGAITWHPLTYVDGSTHLPVADQIGDFTIVWDDTAKIDRLVFVGGNQRFFTWSGALGYISATTANTITLTSDAGQLGFPASGSVYVNGTAYAYTGITDNQLTGVTPDASTLAVGAVVSAGVASHTISTIPVGFTADYVGTFRNSLYVGSNRSRIVLRSNATNYTTFTSSDAVGGGRILTLDDTCFGFVSSRKSIVIFGQNDSQFEIKVTVSADQTKELLEIERLVTAPQQGVISPLAKLRVKNAVMYITRERTLDTVQFVENINDLQTLPVSDLIKNDFDDTDFTNASLAYWERNILIAAPESNICYMYDLERGLWQTPLRWNGCTIGMFSVDEDGNLIGHDAFTTASYKLFSGNNDGGLPIESKAVFAYNHFGDRFANKQFTAYAQDGYITANGTLTRTLDYDFRGAKGSISKDFRGDELQFVYAIVDSAGLGKAPLGERTLAGSSLSPAEDERRFRFADQLVPTNFYELRVIYSMEKLNATWRLVAHGSDAYITGNEINDITRILE